MYVYLLDLSKLITGIQIYFISGHQQSSGKVMFSQAWHVSVCLSTGGWGVCLVPGSLQVAFPFGGVACRYNSGTPPGRYTPKKVHLQKVHPSALTFSAGHQSGRYVSYWNAFLL